MTNIKINVVKKAIHSYQSIAGFNLIININKFDIKSTKIQKNY